MGVVCRDLIPCRRSLRGIRIIQTNIMDNSTRNLQHIAGKHFQYLALICALGAAANSVAAADGRITFSGSIASSTCAVAGGGATVTAASGGNFTVGMPRVSVTALATEGQRAGDTPFHIRLSGDNCTNGAVASVSFEPAQSTNINAATGNLRNATGRGRAGNVEVGLLNHTRGVMNLFANTPQTTATVTNNTARFEYWAQYVATGGASTAGTVNTDVVYSIIYN